MVQRTVAEAASMLGISEAGVRKRIQRGQIPHERGDDGRVLVWISPGETRHAKSRDEPILSRGSDLVPELRDRIKFLERQLEAREDELRRRDVMLLNMTEAMKALNPPSSRGAAGASETAAEARESPVTPVERPEGEEVWADAASSQEGTERPQERRGFWSRLFGG
jgi:hypothetical protein